MINGQSIQGFLVSQPEEINPYHEEIDRLYHAPEEEQVLLLLEQVRMDKTTHDRVNQRACNLVQAVRDRRHERGVLDAFMQQYDLSSEEGVVLMCLAEALLRIPDKETA